MRRGVTGGLLVILAVVVAGFVAQRIFGSETDPMSEATEAIEALPYGVSVREASEGVLVGSARGRHGAVVHFAIAEGEGDHAEDIPPRLIQVDENVSSSGGFTIWEDSEARHARESAVEWREREEIAAEVEGALAR